jgi:hypothetical protein
MNFIIVALDVLKYTLIEWIYEGIKGWLTNVYKLIIWSLLIPLIHK